MTSIGNHDIGVQWTESIIITIIAIIFLNGCSMIWEAFSVADLSNGSSSSSIFDKLSDKFFSMLLSFVLEPFIETTSYFLVMICSFIVKKCSLLKLGDLAWRI